MNLSKPQKLIHDMERYAGGSIAVICISMFIKGKKSEKELQMAVNELFRINDALRIRIKEYGDDIRQYITKFAEQKFEVLYFDDKEDFDAFANSVASKEVSLNESLCDIKIVVFPDKYGILVKMHHFIADAWTGALIATQFTAILNGEKPTGYSYFDYLENETKYVNSKRFIKDKEFFLGQYAKCDEIIFINEKITETLNSTRKVFIIPEREATAIKNYAENNNCSVLSVFSTAFAVYMNRINYEARKLFVGTTVLNRYSEKDLNTAGMFVNTVPLLIQTNSDEPFCKSLETTEDTLMSVFRHQRYNYKDLLTDIRKNYRNEEKLFDVTISYMNAKIVSEKNAVESQWHHNGVQNESLKIHIDDRDNEGIFKMHYDYQNEKFTEHDIDMLHKHICTLLSDALENPDKRICDLEMLSADEKQKLFYDFNDTAADYEKDKCIHELFEEQVERTPGKVAVVATDKTLTYRELNEEANRIAHSLMEKGVCKGDIVGLLLPRKSCFLSALFGVLKTGATYLPIDCDFPEERIKHILSDSNAKLCISEDNISVLLKNQDADNLACTVSGDDFCYCIYTSGSTGKSKGTLVYHRNLVWYMSVLKSIYGTDNINMPFFTSQCVDLTVPSFYFPLLTGGTTYLYNGEMQDDLVDIFNNENLTVLKLTPTHISIICKLIPDKLRSNLRCIIVGGETLYTESCVEFLNKFGNHIEIHNEYGPTEATVSCTDYIFNSKETDLYLPIGSPINNAQLYITDEYLNSVPIGVTGEICIAGDGIGAGYLNNPDLTAEKFIENPFGKGKMYRTGDLAYFREDGNIVFVGRKDFQVKIRGLRIELGEIESALQAIDNIDRAVVVVRKDKEDRQLLCSFYTGEEKSVRELREKIGRILPKYMIPHIFTHLEEMPMTSSGKANRTALPEIDLENIDVETEFVAPNTQEEKTLAGVVCSVLRRNRVNMLDNFFNIGGDSIKAIYIVSELEEVGYELHVADIMQKDTLSDIAKAMKSTSNKAIYDQEEVNGFIPFTPIMRAFLKESNIIQKDFVHTFIISADCDEDTVKKSLDALISHHDILRGTFCDNGIEIHPLNEREVYSFKAITIDDTDKAKEYLKSANIDGNKLVNVVFCNTEKESFISITIHHFLIDLVSWEVFMKDFQTVVKQLKNNEEISLPAKTASFMLWNEELQKYYETMSEENKEYWKNINARLDNTKSLYSHRENENKAEEYSFILDKNISDKLINETNNAYGTRINEVLLTALGLAACKIADGSVGIIVESHGRAELHKPIAIERTIGWFTSCYPVVIDNNNNIVDVLINTKETLRRMPKTGIDYLLLSQGFHKNTDIKFNFYQNCIADEDWKNKLIAFNSGSSVFPGKINVNCFITDAILTVDISVPKCKHKQKISEELGVEFVNQIEKIIDICTTTDTVIKTRSDFSDDELTEIELDELKDLFDWTDDDEK